MPVTPFPVQGRGGRAFGQLLNDSGLTFDGITSTTNTTLSTQDVMIPEGWVGTFVIDVDAWTTAGTASVSVSFDGGTNDNAFYYDRASATASTVSLAATGAYVLRVLNPFPEGFDQANTISFSVKFTTNASNTTYELGKCWFAVAPPVVGAVTEDLSS